MTFVASPTRAAEFDPTEKSVEITIFASLRFERLATSAITRPLDSTQTGGECPICVARGKAVASVKAQRGSGTGQQKGKGGTLLPVFTRRG